MGARSEWIGLIIFLVVCFAVAGLGGMATTPEIPNWYQRLAKPSWTPPNWLFGPVWTVLYVFMAVAAWLVWRRAGWHGSDGALTIFGIQLALNLAWSFIFFKFHLTGWAFAEVALLWVAIAVTIVKFAPISTVAALLLVPYLLWVTYASALNFTIWRMNG
ncbi:MAG TPA: TspO/MBR family protein [Blastocatellia bacterium]|nr:TspO/MBR family protein [Blastocatellia bacterium]